MLFITFGVTFSIDETLNHAPQVHHILAEIIQGGVVLETNLEEIDSSGKSLQSPFKKFCSTLQGAFGDLPARQSCCS